MKAYGWIASGVTKGSMRSYALVALMSLLCAAVAKCNCERIANLILFFSDK